ncbi:MAG: hypothetical protein CVU12_02630 [Bacteroidetes bacterium HGW-Bacteroidetes-7]|jgi:ferric-dicitrate binding protein FerR (iron transport regulator)|nr:MAG: hypothetical protein CVU12_02630 [Bacteroidetes bacterium HGW-Bacteroidetes-7]
MAQEIINPESDILLSKILNNSATTEEIIEFSEWVKDYRNEAYFEKFKEMWNVSRDVWYKKEFASTQNSDRFVSYIRRSKLKARARRAVTFTLSAAASLVLIFGLSQLLFDGGMNSVRVVDFNELSYSTDSVRVELNDGQLVKNIKSTQKSLTNIEDIVSGQAEETPVASPKVFNSITTPAGERVAMLLSDGSRVYLTSNSYLRYPSRFDDDKREVTLVGRAYFEVKKSKVPFIVNTSDMNIEVLGTSFDVESRNTGINSSVILVEGSVKVNAQGKSQIIFPDEQISLHRSSKELTVKSVDSRMMTMWKDGVLIVHGQTFDELVESLASWYGVKIVDKSNVSKSERFNGRFDREDIEAAIKAISISAGIIYKIEDGKLVLEDL